MNALVPLAAAIALLAPTPPFPAPKLTKLTPDTRCDWGPIVSMKSDATEIVIHTDAGALTLTVGRAAKVASADGKPLASPVELRTGTNVRAYYVVDGGAKVVEIDVIP